jgi:membrane protein DedA with SNARE-associated domain
VDIISSQFAALASQNIFLAYLIVYVATIFLGNIGAFTSFWVAFQGGLGTWGVPGVIIAAFAANVSGDLLWYAMGRTLRATRLGAWIKRRFPNHEKFDEHIAERGPRWMLFAKFAYGSNFPILFSLGWARFPFHRFFRRSLLAIALWLPIIIGVSYGLYSSLSPLAAIATIKHFEVLFLAGLVGFIILQIILGKIIGKVFGKNGGEK